VDGARICYAVIDAMLKLFFFGNVKADAILRHPDVADRHGLHQHQTAAPSPVDSVTNSTDGRQSNGSDNRSPYPYLYHYPLSNRSSPLHQPSSPDTGSNCDELVHKASVPSSSSISKPPDTFTDYPNLLDGYTADCLDDIFDDALSHPFRLHDLHHLSMSAMLDPVVAPVGPGSASSSGSSRRVKAKSKAAGMFRYRH